VRTVLVAAKTRWAETGVFPRDAADMTPVGYRGPTVTPGDRPVDVGPVYAYHRDDRLFLSARSASRRCFYLSFDGLTHGYAEDTNCRSATDQDYRAPWREALSWLQQRNLDRRLEPELEQRSARMSAVFEEWMRTDPS
jgi:hypothetical protein